MLIGNDLALGMEEPKKPDPMGLYGGLWASDTTSPLCNPSLLQPTFKGPLWKILMVTQGFGPS